uniref:NB-ARC domain-containing protein n=1 Tax=Oryza barthii TaxID=65489 RepID=A0A0D3F3B8_9ORYZ
MEVAIGAASWLLGKVVTQLSNDLVATYLASTNLGLNIRQIKTDLAYTQGLLNAAEGRDFSNNHGLRILLEELAKKADETEDTLDELHYFILQDQIDGTHETIPEVHDCLRGQAIHGRHAFHHTVGSWFPCFSCFSTRHKASGLHGYTAKSHSDVVDHVSKLSFNRVEMSNKIKLLIESINALCTRVSDLLKINRTIGRIATLKQPPTSSTITQDILYGRKDIFEHTLNDVVNYTIHSGTLPVLTIVGPGGIGKTTFAQHLSEDEWKCLLSPFTKGEARGSVVIVTTRFPYIAQMVKTTNMIELQGLEHNEFFAFFEACIFADCKPEIYVDDLIDIAKEISMKLKGFPLAAKTVRRLLKKNLSQECWIEVLERNEWKNMQNGDGMMPALKISYDYLPFYLKKCFSYCSLYPENYQFNNLEITFFWEAIGIINSSDHNKAEDIGLSYLDELVGNGFLVKVSDDKRQYYVMHDLLHELAQNVSSHECVSIRSYSFRSNNVPQSVRHISITLQDKYDNDFEGEMEKFKRKIDIGNIQTLMYFGEYNKDMTIFFKNIFKETKCIRVLYMFANFLESFPYNFSKLLHLRYLKLELPYDSEFSLPSAMCRFYHLKSLDLGYSKCILPQDISCLVNLRHLISKMELCSNIPGIGKMKYLQWLEEYHVKKEDIGFELSELGNLTELGGELKIFNLENVATREEANDAKLISKRNLKALTLCAKQLSIGSGVLDGLQPHPNLRALDIRNHGGSTGPTWLCGDVCVKGLKSLHLEGLSWGTLPPFGQLMHLEELTLINVAGIRKFGPDFGGVTQKSFLHLKKIKFVGMPELVEWVGGAHWHLFLKLASIRCEDCPNFSVLLLPFSKCSVICTQDKHSMIRNCPKLSLPPMPHNTMLTRVTVKEDNQEKLHFEEETLRIDGYGGALAFHNLDKVKDVTIENMFHISLTDLQKLNSLTSLDVTGCKSMLSSEVDNATQSQRLSSYRKIIGGRGSSTAIPIAQLIARYLNLKSQESGSSSGGCGWRLSPTSLLLETLEINGCGNMFSQWSMVEAGAQTRKPFPTSLKELSIVGESSMQSMAPLSNLTSLTSLTLKHCVNLTVDGFNPFITYSLKELVVYNNPESGNNNHRCSIAKDMFSEVARTKVMPAGGSFQQLVRLDVDSISAVFVETICSLLAATLIELRFTSDLITDQSFTEKQEQKGESKMSQGQRHIDPVWSTGHNACSNRMASKVTETAPGALSNGLWLAWAECAQTNQPMCVFGVAQGPARLLGFSSLYSSTHCKQRGARSLLPPRMTPPDE